MKRFKGELGTVNSRALTLPNIVSKSQRVDSPSRPSGTVGEVSLDISERKLRHAKFLSPTLVVKTDMAAPRVLLVPSSASGSLSPQISESLLLSSSKNVDPAASAVPRAHCSVRYPSTTLCVCRLPLRLPRGFGFICFFREMPPALAGEANRAPSPQLRT